MQIIKKRLGKKLDYKQIKMLEMSGFLHLWWRMSFRGRSFIWF